jgi:hypothetical protein
MQERLKKIQEEKAESFKKAQEEAFLRDLETFKEKADKNGEWMTRIRVSDCSWLDLPVDGRAGDHGEAHVHRGAHQVA